MRFNCGPTAAEKRAAKCQWHRWFAWYPVRVKNNCVWLEFVQRRWVPNYPYDAKWERGYGAHND